MTKSNAKHHAKVEGKKATRKDTDKARHRQQATGNKQLRKLQATSKGKSKSNKQRHEQSNKQRQKHWQTQQAKAKKHPHAQALHKRVHTHNLKHSTLTNTRRHCHAAHIHAHTSTDTLARTVATHARTHKRAPHHAAPCSHVQSCTLRSAPHTQASKHASTSRNTQVVAGARTPPARPHTHTHQQVALCANVAQTLRRFAQRLRSVCAMFTHVCGDFAQSTSCLRNSVIYTNIGLGLRMFTHVCACLRI
jgi:hypothetical protein